MVTALELDTIILSASFNLHQLLLFLLKSELLLLEALLVLLLFLILDRFPLQDVLLELGLVIILHSLGLEIELLIDPICKVLHVIFHFLRLFIFQLSSPLHPCLKAFEATVDSLILLHLVDVIVVGLGSARRRISSLLHNADIRRGRRAWRVTVVAHMRRIAMVIDLFL